jgi:formamidopyrimidine-DNA glycosylase
MPELPEVETIVRGLRGEIVGRAITTARVNWPRHIVDLTPEAFAARIAGQRIESLGRRGKYILFHLSDDDLIIHLRMTGRLYVSPPGVTANADRWAHVVFGLDDGNELRFSDVRKLGRLYLVADAEEVVGKLGPEPLDDTFTLEAFRERIATRSGMLKPLLLNQRFIAGVGNIYADESLWQAGIAPRRKADTLTAREVEALYHAIRGALQDGIDHEGTTLSWYRKPDGSAGTYQDHFKVYSRPDEPCPRCGTPIRKIWLGQRGTHFCPKCQK